MSWNIVSSKETRNWSTGNMITSVISHYGKNPSPQYNWNIAETVVQHHNPKSYSGYISF